MYDWRYDIEDCDEVLDRDEFGEVAYNLVEIHPDEEDFINLFRISTDSALYSMLEDWYDQQGLDMQDSIRGYYEDEYNGYIDFVTGSGYSIYSADLLGGSADGVAERKFDEFVRDRF